MADPKPKMIKGVVARGRTVRAGGGPIYDKDDKVIGHTDGDDYGPGQEVELVEAEYKEAVKHGFLNNPDADAPVISTGPKIQLTDDPKR